MKHICQSEAWANFKTKMGTPAVKAGGVWFTVHTLPGIFKALPWKVGYCPKVEGLTKEDVDALAKEGEKQKCAFIKVESNEPKNQTRKSQNTLAALATNSRQIVANSRFVRSSRTFASHTLLLDLTKSEEELLAGMHQKTRYNIKVAERHGVIVEEKNDAEGLALFLKLQKATADRQKFYIHPDNYYRTLWETFSPGCHSGLDGAPDGSRLDPESSRSDSGSQIVASGTTSAHILIARLGNEPLGALFLLRYGDTFYYPYGGTADTHRESMFGTLLMWEAIKLGKRLSCKIFDMWGAAATDDPKDPWSGFTRFKKGFGGRLVEFEDTYDLVLNKPLYFLLTFGNKLRWSLLRIRKLL